MRNQDQGPTIALDNKIFFQNEAFPGFVLIYSKLLNVGNEAEKDSVEIQSLMSRRVSEATGDIPQLLRQVLRSLNGLKREVTDLKRAINAENASTNSRREECGDNDTYWS